MEVPTSAEGPPRAVAPGRSPLGFRPGIEGLRGVAITLVVVFHALTLCSRRPIDVLPGSFAGVDVFFVLSGFLITGLLLEEHRVAGHLRLRRFYVRRALRLLPAVGAFVAVTTAYVVATGLPPRAHVRSVVAVATYSTNWWIDGGAALTDGYAHLWSLAIEEQFYVVWPIVLGLVLRLCRPRPGALAPVLAGAVAAAAAWRVVLWQRHQVWSEVYFRTDARLEGLLLGALLAALVADGRVRVVPRPRLLTLGALALAGFVVAVDAFHAAYATWGASLVAAASAALVLGLLEPAGPVGAVLGSAPLRYLGRISYPLYLWHVAADFVVRRYALDAPLLVRIVAPQVAAVAVADLTRRAVEVPALRLRDRLGAAA